MAVIAPTLLDAVSLTNSQIGTGNAGNFLFFYISQFNFWSFSFDPAVESDRPVRNWIVSGKVLEAETPVSGNSQQRQAVVDYIVRVLYAANAAFNRNAITIAQRNAVLNAWNASVGAVP